jgi:YD repeat-containing protein
MSLRRFLMASAIALMSAAPAAGLGQTLTYDAQGRLASATYSDGTLICYAYDGGGNRAGYHVSSSGSCFTPVTHTYTTGSSATETVPTGASTATITMWSGGGGGGKDTTDVGGGGGGGCQVVQTISVQGGNTFTYSVGGGGAGRSTNGTGGSGGSSSVSGTVSGGSVSMSTTHVATGGQMAEINGNGAVCSGVLATSGAAGNSPYGGNAGGVGGGAGGGAWTNGSAPGGGGGGSGTPSRNSGSGAAGEVIFAYH